MALTWDFARQISPGADPGNTTSYFDAMQQALYTFNGEIYTQSGALSLGQWQDTPRGVEIEKIISDTGYSKLDIEHQNNGVLYAVAQHNANFVLLIYQYMMDVSANVLDASIEHQPDNPIKGGNITVQNIDNNLFEDSEHSVFVPGNKVSISMRVGSLLSYELCTFYIESSPYSIPAESFSFSGRNKIGFFLAQQTFDENNVFVGSCPDILISMLSLSGLSATDYMVETGTLTEEITLTFNAKDSILSGILAIVELLDWYIDDLPSGLIVIGSAEYIMTNVATTGIYDFKRNEDVFTHTIDRSIDGVFSRLCLQRNGMFPKTVYFDIDYFDGWQVAPHRTFYQDVPDTTTDEQMTTVAEQMIERMKYTGIVETFYSTIRPWLHTGDIAHITDVGPRYPGIITNFTHSIGRAGFFTSITVASGGVSDPDELNPTSAFVGKLGGVNRKRRLLDYLQKYAKNSSSNTSGSAGSSAGVSQQEGAVVYDTAIAGGYTGTNQSLYSNLAQMGTGAIIPTGGTVGQLLEKTAADNYAVSWTDQLRNLASIAFTNGAVITNHLDQQILEITNADGTTLQVGGELWFIAKANEALTNGDIVELAGSQGDHALVKKATTTGIIAVPGNFMGVATHDVAQNGWVKCTWFGYVSGLNTASYTLGDILYFDTATGLMTKTPPTSGLKLGIAVVTRVHATEGMMLVRPHFYVDTSTYDAIATQFDENLVYQATGDATVWEDLRVPLNATKIAGTNQPGWEAWINGLFLYWFDAATEEEVWFSVQMPHSWAGTAIIPHVHWTPKVTADGTPANQTVEWGLEYSWVDISGDFPASQIVYGKTSLPNDANIVANRHYMTNLTSISPTASQDGLSSMLVCRLFRNATDGVDDTYENDAGLLEFDIHYEVDMLGSRSVSSK